MKIRRRRHNSVPTLNMASMPDLIFTVLFFFMIVTHMRTETPKIQITTPEGTELTKTSRQRTVVNMYVGKDSHGVTHIQIGKHMVTLEQVSTVVKQLKERLEGEEADMFTVNIRADKNTEMGVITDIKKELRKAGALNIRYGAIEQQHK